MVLRENKGNKVKKGKTLVPKYKKMNKENYQRSLRWYLSKPRLPSLRVGYENMIKCQGKRVIQQAES